MFRSLPRLTFLALLALALASCQKPLLATLGQPVGLPVHHAATFAKSDLELYFRRVASDSRCPTGAQCIWAGEAFVTVDARLLKGPVESFDLRLPGAAVPDSAIWKPYDGYRIRLVSLEPFPAVGKAADSTSYVGTFLVEKR